MYWRIEFVFVWSTSNYHHVNPPVSAVVKCKMVDSDYYGLKVKMPLWPFSEHCFYATYFNIPVAEVSCVCSDKAWCPLATVDVDPGCGLNHPTSWQIPTCLWNGNYQILPGISIFGIDSPLPKAEDLRNLWSYVFCKGVQMTTVADYLDNAGFNTTAKN